MKCREAKTAIARWGGPTAGEVDELSLHLRSCSECATVARSQRLTRYLLEVLTPDQDASPHFFTRLRARLREVERPAHHAQFPLKALIPALASLTVILASATYLLSPPPPSPVLSFLDSPAGGSETFSFLGILPPTHDQILASILEAEERTR